MPIGPGKYDDALAEALKHAKAMQGILIVLEGSKGFGFSAQLELDKTLLIPGMLRELARMIEADHKSGNL